MLLPAFWRCDLGGLLFRLPALGAAQLFTRQLFVERLATIDADLAAFIFSAHTLDCGEPRLYLAKVSAQPGRVTSQSLRVTPTRLAVTPCRFRVTLTRLAVTACGFCVTLPVTPRA